MNILWIILSSNFLLQFDEGTSQTDSIHRYHRPGVDAKLSCVKLKYQGPECLYVDWIYYKDDHSDPVPLVEKGILQKSSRFSFSSVCSLTVHNITEKDAGKYVCGLNGRVDSDTNVYLKVLTDIHRFHRPGEDAELLCDRMKHQGPGCLSVDWLYYKDGSNPVTLVRKGKLQKSSRFSLSPRCSLTVHNITEEDTGKYVCGRSGHHNSDSDVYLNVFTVSPAPPSTNPEHSGLTSLQCTLWRYSSLSCTDGRFQWFDTNGEVLSGADITDNNCVSYLTVRHQNNRKYTCRYMMASIELFSAEYSLENQDSPDSKSTKPDSLVPIISAAVVCLLVLLVVAAVVIFKIKSKKTKAETIQDNEGDPQPATFMVDPDNNMTYAMINHQKGTPRKQVMVVEEDTVTYSAVKVKPTDDSNHSAIYSTVNKTTS